MHERGEKAAGTRRDAARRTIRRRLREELAVEGIEVAADCGTIRELMAVVLRERPDVCVLDRELCGGGLVAVAAVARDLSAPRVLVVGGRGTPPELRAAQLAGAVASVPANVSAAALVSAVSALVTKEER